jgi:hypothetical protein
MVKLLSVGGFLFDVATAAGSWTGGAGQHGLAMWVALNASLLVLPLAYHTIELLWTAITNAPEVLTCDVTRVDRFEKLPAL